MRLDPRRRFCFRFLFLLATALAWSLAAGATGLQAQEPPDADAADAEDEDGGDPFVVVSVPADGPARVLADSSTPVRTAADVDQHGTARSMPQLAADLAAAADAAGRTDGGSKLGLVMVIDANASFGRVQQLLAVANDPRVRITRRWFAFADTDMFGNARLATVDVTTKPGGLDGLVALRITPAQADRAAMITASGAVEFSVEVPAADDRRRDAFRDVESKLRDKARRLRSVAIDCADDVPAAWVRDLLATLARVLAAVRDAGDEVTLRLAPPLLAPTLPDPLPEALAITPGRDAARAFVVNGAGAAGAIPEPAVPQDADPLGGAIPSWVLDVPSEPGVAFYGVGVASYRNPAMMDRAFKASDAGGRRQIADAMKATVQTTARRYARQVLGQNGQIHEDALSQDCTRAVTNFVLMGSAVVKRDVYYDRQKDLSTCYSLVRISFDSVCESLRNEVMKAIEKVERNAKHDFDAMDRMLKEEHEKNQPHVAPPADLPPLERNGDDD